MKQLLPLIWLGAGLAAGQPAGIVLHVSEVDVALTVTDRKGRFVDDLAKEHFQVTENGRPQSVLGVAAPGETPLRVALVLDASTSVAERFKQMQNTASGLVRDILRPGRDEVVLASFGSVVEQAVQTTQPDEAVRAIREFRPGGGTALLDAVYTSIRDRLRQGTSPQRFRAALILLSDGEDNDSFYTRGQTAELAQSTGVPIYAISTNFAPAETRGDKVLAYLAEASGGRVVFPFKTDGAGDVLRKIADDLRHQYSLFYRPDPLATDGKYRTIGVRVKGRTGLVVRARKGYYAPHS
jgi:VWFA-related protein